MLTNKIAAIQAIRRLLREQQTVISTGVNGTTTITPGKPEPTLLELKNLVEDIMKLGATEAKAATEDAKQHLLTSLNTAIRGAIDGVVQPASALVWLLRCPDTRYVDGVFATREAAEKKQSDERWYRNHTITAFHVGK